MKKKETEEQSYVLQQRIWTVTLPVNPDLKIIAKADYIWDWYRGEFVSEGQRIFNRVQWKIKYSFRATVSPCLLLFLLSFFRGDWHLQIVLNSSLCLFFQKGPCKTISKQEFMHFSFLTPHTGTTLTPLYSGASPFSFIYLFICLFLDRQEFCTAYIISANTSTTGLWLLVSAVFQ